MKINSWHSPYHYKNVLMLSYLTFNLMLVAKSVFAQEPVPPPPPTNEPAPPPPPKLEPANPLGVGSPGVSLFSNEQKLGWTRYFSLGITGSSNESKDVVGRENGNTTTIGGKILGNLSLREENNDWRNNLSFVYTTARNPYVSQYVKSDDQLSLSSLYIYRLSGASWFGPFGRVVAKTVTTEGEDVRSGTRTYTISKRDGTIDAVTADRIKLNDPWKPTILKETVGAYFEIYGSKIVTVEALVGIGARQVYAKNQLVSIDNPNTIDIELLQLNDSTHLGGEGILQVHGLLLDDKFSYTLAVDGLFPTRSTGGIGETRTAYEGRIIETDGTLSLKLTNWLALDYTLSSLRDLDLSDNTQMSNTIQFSLNYVMSQ